jgi:alkyl hydroperoxide reductase subunit F
MLSLGHSGLEPDIEQLASRIATPTHLEILVTLTCPYCPSMVRLAHQIAFLNENVRADMIDAAEFPTLVERYHVQGVPRTVINERLAFEGAMLPAAAVMAILKEVEPETAEALDAASREARGERAAREARPDELYDVIVVGAGPAGLAAALYAARKNRHVALIGKQLGGQINDTASVENYLGMPRIGGRELAERFRKHLETYPVAEHCHAEVRRITTYGGGFEVATVDGRAYRARTVIYAAGKQYRRLGVPGEERLLGKGIAFCGSVEKRVGYAVTYGLMREKSSLPAIMKMTMRMVRNRPYPRALRLAAWKSPLMASRNPFVWREVTQARMPSR